MRDRRSSSRCRSRKDAGGGDDGGRGWVRWAVLWSVILLIGFGCRSPNARESAAPGSIVIQGKTLEEIRHAAIVVFSREHYRLSYSGQSEISFEKKVGGMSELIYGNWANNDQGVWERFRLSFTPDGPGLWRVDCEVFRVTNHGQGFFEDEAKLSKGRSSSSQKLLRSIKDTVDAGGGPAFPP